MEAPGASMEAPSRSRLSFGSELFMTSRKMPLCVRVCCAVFASFFPIPLIVIKDNNHPVFFVIIIVSSGIFISVFFVVALFVK